MKSVLISIQPYYVFLIIARLMGWDIPQEKTVEGRKNYPNVSAWNKVTHIYCSKNRKSFNRIPKQYQPFMAKLLGKVIGEFVCDRIEEYAYSTIDGVDIDDDTLLETMLGREEINLYAKGKTLYGWHISDLKIYDKPKELGELGNLCRKDCLRLGKGKSCEFLSTDGTPCNRIIPITRPPQSWCYVEA